MNLRLFLSSLADDERISIMDAFNNEREYIVKRDGYFIACHYTHNDATETAGYWSFGKCA